MTGLESDISSLKKQWEQVTNDLIYHESCIANLIGKEVMLESELDQRNARVVELVALVEAQQLSNECMSHSLGRSHDSIELLRADLNETKEMYNESCTQVSYNVVMMLLVNCQLLDERYSFEVKQCSNVFSKPIELSKRPGNLHVIVI